MKNIFTTLLLVCAASVYALTPRVISEQQLGHGFYPHISADGTEVIYLDSEHDSYAEPQPTDLYVTNEDLNLALSWW